MHGYEDGLVGQRIDVGKQDPRDALPASRMTPPGLLHPGDEGSSSQLPHPSTFLLFISGQSGSHTVMPLPPSS